MLRYALSTVAFVAGLEGVADGAEGSAANSCLVAIGRLQVASMPACSDLSQPPSQFMTRHGQDGKFTFVDQRSAL